MPTTSAASSTTSRLWNDDRSLGCRTSTAVAWIVDADSDERHHAAELSELLAAAHRRAARYGLERDLFELRAGRMRPAADDVRTLLDAAAPGLERHGVAEEVGAVVGSVLQHGDGATRQNRVYREGGPSSLVSLIDEDGR